MEPMRETATLGGGCFWCLDAVFRELRGVATVESGYAGGTVANPSYEEVCRGTTGHAEVVRVTFDSSVVRYRDLLEVFFTIHDPTTVDRQGADVGPQYRSILLVHSTAQEEVAAATIAELSDAKVFDDPIVTEVAPAGAFYPAEAYHQDYYARNSRQPYCRAVIEPKLGKFRATWAKLRKGA